MDELGPRGFPQLDYIEAPRSAPKAGSALELLQAVYRDPEIDLFTRLRAARDALPFESPKLAVVAQVGAPHGLAERLEAALAAAERVQAERSGRAPQTIEGTARPKALAPPEGAPPEGPGDC